MANQSMDDKFFIQKNSTFFQGVSPRWHLSNNYHLLALHGHGSHVSLKAIEHAQQFVLDMIILPSHTSMPSNL